MTGIGWLQIIIFFATIVAVTKPLGIYMVRVFEGERQPMPRLFGGLERLCYRLSGIDPKREQTWKEYTFALLVFSAIGVVVTYLIQRLQGVLPFNPQHFGAVEQGSAFNTAAS
ncbi:MAG: potassium-transporting ATPase subunit, partial [Myxococcales bacterium]|nr:potassium-transporting ATPase subunit [Myxococcales bacterium]